MNEWVGKWWAVIWSGRYKIVEVGLGEDHGEIQSVVLTRRVKRFGPFWLSVAKPTLRALNS